jgi:hypothetical protein
MPRRAARDGPVVACLVVLLLASAGGAWAAPLDGLEPAERVITLRQGTRQTFRVLVPRPWADDVRVDWYVDGRPAGRGTDFTLQSSTMTVGPHTIEAEVRERTPSRRRDPARALIGTARWDVTVIGTSGTITGFSGTGEGVERAAGRTGIVMTGTLVVDGPIDLGAVPATVRITRLLHEVGGAGETVAGLPLVLTADRRNSDKVARFTSPAGAVPIATLTLGSKGSGEFTFRLNVTRATSVVAGQCPDPTLTTTFLIHDGVNPPVTVSTQQRWICFGSGHQYLRAPR